MIKTTINQYTKFDKTAGTKVSSYAEGKLYMGDSTKVMKKLLDSGIIIDAIITDPPYNISRKNNFSTIGREGFNWNWDKEFCQIEWIEVAIKLLKKNGNILIFNDWKNLGLITRALNIYGCEEKDILVWKKTNPMPRNTKRRYLPQLEFLLWAVKTKGEGKRQPWTFNLNGEPKLSPIITFSSTSQKRIHPTQKPIPLLEKLIETHTNKGELILDPFSGSSSLAIAAIKKKRNFICIEKNKDYFMEGKKWIESNSKEIGTIRSPLYYLGDKYRIFDQISKFLPDKIDVFYDVFGGGGTILANIKANNIVYNDKTKQLTKLLEIIYKDSKSSAPVFLEKVKGIIDKYGLSSTYKTKYERNGKNFLRDFNKVGFERLKTDYNNLKNKNTISAAQHLFTLLVYSFNSQLRFNKAGKFNTPIGKSDLNKNRMNVFENFLKRIKHQQIEFINSDYMDILEIILKCNEKNIFVYLDPPYLVTNAQYNSEWNIKEEEHLLLFMEKLIKSNISWGLSNAVSSKGIENRLLCNWLKKNKHLVLVEEIHSSHKNSNYQRKGSDVEEVYIHHKGRI